MPTNPIDLYIKEIIRIGTEVLERDVWCCDDRRLDRLQAVEHFVIEPPKTYSDVIAKLRGSLEDGAVTYAGVQDFVDIRSFESSLMQRVAALPNGNVAGMVAEENRRRIIAEARQIASRDQLLLEKRENRLKAETIASMERALTEVEAVSQARINPVAHLEAIEIIAAGARKNQSCSAEFQEIVNALDRYRRTDATVLITRELLVKYLSKCGWTSQRVHDGTLVRHQQPEGDACALRSIFFSVEASEEGEAREVKLAIDIIRDIFGKSQAEVERDVVRLTSDQALTEAVQGPDTDIIGRAIDFMTAQESELRHLRSVVESYRAADHAAGARVAQPDALIADPKSYDEIVRNIGDVVPCYRLGEAGCRLDDPTNGEHCGDGCLMLKVYRSALAIGLKEGMRKSDALGDAIGGAEQDGEGR